ncbi:MULTISPECIES: alpha/beta fold hydrolase [Amycolatopsis]|uniref:Epoxide hydrolase EphF n=1 Tax=Amycolatopsis bullii TaxID=941987 RepID=A0ABQ3KHK9_9PSEU|nr:alpha/beta fold hydrolase [Amycolatopsis bullii]GHG25338.1 epoxide hydrolase EphF [Amycolatopsis bullii]
MNEDPFPAVDGVTHRFVQAGAVRLHVAEAGSGPPVLLLHSFPQHWYAWRRVIPGLATDHRVLCPDFRGAGWSDAPPDGYDTATRVDDLLALLDALGLDEVPIVSHGWGAWTAFALCLRAPERVRAHLALTMTHPWPARRALRRAAWRFWHTTLWELPLLGPAVLRHWPGLTRFLLRHWGAAEDGVAEFAERSRRPGQARAGQQLNWQFVVHDLPKLRRPGADRPRMPTEILAGGRDVLVPPELLGDVLPVRVLADCGHLIPEQRPDAVVAAARALFGGS